MLTETEERIVTHLAHKGGSIRGCALVLGIPNSTVRYAMNQERVAQALHDRLTVGLYPVAAEAIRILRVLMRRAKSEAVRRQAASDLLDRVIPKQVTEKVGGVATVSITFTMSSQPVVSQGVIVDGSSAVVEQKALVEPTDLGPGSNE